MTLYTLECHLQSQPKISQGMHYFSRCLWFVHSSGDIG